MTSPRARLRPSRLPNRQRLDPSSQALGKLKRDDDMDAETVASTLQHERCQAEAQDDGMLGSLLGMLGGAAQHQQASGGGLLGALGGLFRKKG